MSKVTVRPAESAASGGGLGTRLYNALHRKLTKPACCAETTESCSPTIGFGGFMARSEGG